MKLTGENVVLGEQSLRFPQIPHRLTWIENGPPGQEAGDEPIGPQHTVHEYTHLLRYMYHQVTIQVNSRSL